MRKIFQSATKLTLLALVAALIALTALGILDPKTFDYAIVSVISFYFGQKSNPSKGNEIE